MGSYPSASLLYGIDLGLEEEEERPDWLTEELEEEYGSPGEVLDHLLKGVPKVGYDTYGNFNSGYTGLALCTQAVHATAYTAESIGGDQLTDTVEDDARLKEAWAILYPDQIMPEPGWFMVVSYG
jgi:hypothetical protein